MISMTQAFRGLRRRIVDAYWERKFGVDTTGLKPGPVEDGNWYVTSPYRAMFQVLQAVGIGAMDHVFDIGCGKGRVLLAASRFPARQITGVEIDGELAAIARAHVARQPDAHRFRILEQSATEVDYDDATVIVMFEPLGIQTLTRTIGRLRDSVARRPRPLRIGYVMAVEPLTLDVLSGSGWLEPVDRFEIQALGSRNYLATIWHSKPEAVTPAL